MLVYYLVYGTDSRLKMSKLTFRLRNYEIEEILGGNNPHARGLSRLIEGPGMHSGLIFKKHKPYGPIQGTNLLPNPIVCNLKLLCHFPTFILLW